MTAPLRHPLTSAQRNAKRQALHRAKVKLKLARLGRYEAALRVINIAVNQHSDGDVAAPYALEAIGDVARNALNAEAEA